MYKLVQVSFDYADEFQCEEFQVMSEEKYEAWIKQIKSLIKEDDEFYFGTNEYLEFESFEEFNEGLTVYDITEEEYQIFQKYFPHSFGTSGLFNL